MQLSVDYGGILNGNEPLGPFPMEKLNGIAKNTDVFLAVEMSCGQMVEDVALAVNGQAKIEFLGRAGGGVPTVEQVLGKIKDLTTATATT